MNRGHGPKNEVITRRSKRAVLPSSDAERSAPLHVGPASIINLALIKERANDQTLANFEACYNLLFEQRPLDFFPAHEPPSGCAFAHDDALQCQAHGIISPVSDDDITQRPTVAYCKAFTTMEWRATGPRRRVILHPALANEHVNQSGYQPDVPLKHVSRYISVVHDQVASLRDLKLGFWGVEIPESARSQFRFLDDRNMIWEMNRLPMGHTVAPELMQIITSILAGHPDYVKPEFAAPPTVTVHIWIDNIRWTGPRRDVARASAAADRLAAAANVTWKAEDTRDLVTRYEFIGVAFDHDARTVSLSGKNATRLPDEIPERISFDTLEVLIGRLIFAAGALCIPLAHVWWPIKWARRRYYDFNHQKIHLSDDMVVPPAVSRGLSWWLRHARRSYRVPAVRPGAPSVLFSDASLRGWGAVLVTSRQEVFVAGGPWPRDHVSGDINVLEARALDLGLAHLRDAFLRSGDPKLDILVDNTSVESGVRRGVGHSPFVSDALCPAIAALRELGIPITVDYIRTAENPADAPSRGGAVDLDLATGTAHERRGGGRVPIWCPTPVDSVVSQPNIRRTIRQPGPEEQGMSIFVRDHI